MKSVYYTLKKLNNNKVKIKKLNNNKVIIAARGPLGSVSVTINQNISIKKINNFYYFKGNKKNTKKVLVRSLKSTTALNKETINLISRNLKIMDNNKDKTCLLVDAGYSNKVKYFFKGNENFLIEEKNKFSLFSLDIKKPKEIARQLRSLRAPNPYTGKGIFVNNEKVKKKQGKKTQY